MAVNAEAEVAVSPATDPHSYLLLLRFALLNIIAFALVALAFANGLIQQAFDADATRFVAVIALVFAAGLALTTWRVMWTSSQLNKARNFDPAQPSRAARYITSVSTKDAQSRQTMASGLRLELSQNITVIRHIGSSLVFLGLIGTVIGFIIALSGVDPDLAGEAETIGPMVSALIAGMSTALTTTLVGGVLNIWLMANYQLLSTGTARLINTIVERGEDLAGA
ncbi:MAG: MotA/TolQ/ExbB proton channel family protein [Alphaproteobacteria bacterium]|jgi:biopolymer transport protein ExbB/TolQ|nr:MotA/TolQ/ExbB proton channel family protein [Alphaproteobacteria bacterium]